MPAPAVRENRRHRGQPRPTSAAARDDRPPKRLLRLGIPDDSFLTSAEVAQALQVSTRLLADWRYQDKYLPYYSFGGVVRYRLADLAHFLEESINEDPSQEVTPRQRAAIRQHLGQAFAAMSAVSGKAGMPAPVRIRSSAITRFLEQGGLSGKPGGSSTASKP